MADTYAMNGKPVTHAQALAAIYTTQGAENLGRENPHAANPFKPNSPDWDAFWRGATIAQHFDNA